MKSISRRDFLKLGGLALSGLAFTPFLPELTGFDDIELIRVAYDLISVYKEPDDRSRIVATWPRDSLVNVYETVRAETPGYNPIWYRVFGGYMHRARLQKVRIHYNTPLRHIPETKLLSEVTVPYAQAYRYNQWDGWFPTFRMYYGSIQWITGLDAGPDGEQWYQVIDEADESIHYVPSVQLRPFAAEEIAPISPEVPIENKRIDVDLRTQMLTCFEHGQDVFSTAISGGLPGPSPTPLGRFNIMVKLPSRRMSSTNFFAEDIVLAGVPWCSFFTAQGHALHGTFWHDNFGVPMSRGCINMRNEDALWLFRWTRPTSGFDDINKLTLDVKGRGTFVDIHY